MALVLSGERLAAAASSFNLFLVLKGWAAKARARREQRIALRTLLEIDPHRLDDLGINRGDLFDAMHAPNRPTRLLNDRRRLRAGN